MASTQSLFLSLLFLVIFTTCNAQQLKLNYYKKTCPSVEAIVKGETARFMSVDSTLAASLLRLHFHDCFVRGCDASVLLNSSKNMNQSHERDFAGNLSLRGFGFVEKVKAAVESKCPGVVSCADILALLARDAILHINGPFWPVGLGRKDGRVSKSTEAMSNLPSPFHNFSQLKAIFASKGLTTKDLVVLSGSHTIGISFCSTFSKRLYNFTGRGDTAPSLDSNYAVRLRSKCRPDDPTTSVAMDPGSVKTFDQHYYSLVAKRRGLFESDSALLCSQIQRRGLTSCVKRQ